MEYSNESVIFYSRDLWSVVEDGYNELKTPIIWTAQ